MEGENAGMGNKLSNKLYVSVRNPTCATSSDTLLKECDWPLADFGVCLSFSEVVISPSSSGRVDGPECSSTGRGALTSFTYWIVEKLI